MYNNTVTSKRLPQHAGHHRHANATSKTSVTDCPLSGPWEEHSKSSYSAAIMEKPESLFCCHIKKHNSFPKGLAVLLAILKGSGTTEKMSGEIPNPLRREFAC